jgi:glycopeptide antibiotics resistance protein
MRSNKIYLIHVLIPLVLGLILYLVLQPEAYVSTFIRQILHMDGWELQGETVSGSPLLLFLRNFGSDILWAYALVFAVYFFARNTKMPLYGVFLLCALFLLLIEILQYTDIIPGIFDIIDIILESAAACAAIFMLWIMRKGEQKGYEK